MNPRPAGSRWPASVWAAMFVVYVVWATSYLAIKEALTAFPPILMCGLRSLLAGGVLYAWMRWRGGPRPTPGQWRDGAVAGLLAVTAGSSLLAIGMRDADAGNAAVLYAAMPIIACSLLSVLDRRFARLQWCGAALGLAGIVLLNLDTLLQPGTGSSRGNALVLASAGCAAVAAVAISRARRPASAIWAACIQLLAGGAGAVLIGLVSGERIGTPTAAGLLAFFYLAITASVAGYVAYNHLNQRAGPAVAASFAYVNPPVALALDAVLLDQRPNGRAMLATALVMCGVALTIRSTRTRALPSPQP